MNVSVTYHGMLAEPTAPERVALEAIMARLELDKTHLPGSLDVQWVPVKIVDRPIEELSAFLKWSGAEPKYTVWIQRTDVFDQNQFDTIRMGFNRALSKFYMIHADQRLRDFDMLMATPAETVVAS